MRAIGTLVAVVLVSLAGVAGPVAMPAAGQQSVETDDVVMTVEVDEDGNAHWTIEYRTQLNTQEREDAFDAMQEDIRENTSTYTNSFLNGLEDMAVDAREETGRDMSIDNVTVEAEVETIPQKYGVVTYSFTWENFATTNGDTVYIGDSVTGLYLNADTTFVLEVPDGYEVNSVTPTPTSEREGVVVWSGEMQFTSDGPRVTAVETETSNNTPNTGTQPNDPTDPGTDDPNPDNSDNGDGLPLVPLVGGGLLATVIAGGVAYHRGVIDFGDTSDESDVGDHDVEPAATAATEPVDDDEDDEEADDEPDEELLSNEEKVMRELEENGGRMKQKQLVDELGWSDAKTSRVVSDLRESGEIDGFRLGRENVLELPEDEEEETDEE